MKKYLKEVNVKPEFGSPFSGVALDRKVTESELIRAIRFMIAVEYEQYSSTCNRRRKS